MRATCAWRAMCYPALFGTMGRMLSSFSSKTRTSCGFRIRVRSLRRIPSRTTRRRLPLAPTGAMACSTPRSCRPSALRSMLRLRAPSLGQLLLQARRQQWLLLQPASGKLVSSIPNSLPSAVYTPNSMASVADLESVSKLYGTFVALRKVSLGFERGRCYVLLGENGAGKSTLLRLIAGLIPPTYGSLRVFGEKPENVRERIGYMSHASMLYDEFSAVENLRYF